MNFTGMTEYVCANMTVVQDENGNSILKSTDYRILSYPTEQAVAFKHVSNAETSGPATIFTFTSANGAVYNFKKD